MWGILTECCAEAARLRFIPTRVGNTMARLSPLGSRTVHPHACGEYLFSTLWPRSLIGSSPRVWGIRAGHRAAGRPHRFIPTRVGNTAARKMSVSRFAVHPHACGEYVKKHEIRRLGYGSSPRVWGILPFFLHTMVVPRFIPTRVGNTFDGQIERSPSTVHTHACGEYTMIPESASCKSGSSPRVWGILAAGRQMNKAERFIPTRVGNTPVIGPAMYIFTVHPHACGEYGGGGFNQALSDGSSPRVWGIHHRRVERDVDRRFIPTRVGNT